MVVASVRIRWEGEKSELSSDDGKDTTTVVPSLLLSDIYPKHIKQIKGEKRNNKLGIMDPVLCRPFFLSFKLSLWLINVFVCRKLGMFACSVRMKKKKEIDACRR